MKKSFMTRVLATGLSLAMAFSLTAATNVSVASAAAKPAMKSSKMTVKVGQKKNYQATAATQKAYKITKIKMSAAGQTKAKVTINSSKKSIKVEGLAATKGSNVVITFKNNSTKKTTTVTTKVVVKATAPAVKQGIASVTQKSFTTLEVKFQEALEKIDGTFAITRVSDNQDIQVKASDLDATDKTKVTLTTYLSLTDGKEYKVTYTANDEAKTVYEKNVTVTDGTVADVAITPLEVTVNEATEIKCQTLDANGLVLSEKNIKKVENKIDISWTSTLGTVDDSNGKLTLYNVGDTATFTVTYHTYKYDTQGTGAEIGVIKKDFVVTAVKDATVVSLYNYTIATERPYSWSKVTPVTTMGEKDGVTDAARNAYFQIKDSKGNDITDTCGYTVESSDNSIVVADGEVKSPVALVPVKQGSAYLMIKDKDGKVVETKPITVGAKRKVTSLKLSTYSVSVASKASATYESAFIEVTAKDQYGDKVGTIKEIKTKTDNSACDPSFSGNLITVKADNNGTAGTEGKTDTYEVVVSDNNDGTMSQTFNASCAKVTQATPTISVIFTDGTKIVNSVDTAITESANDPNAAAKNITANVVEVKNGVVIGLAAKADALVREVSLIKNDGTKLAYVTTGSASIVSSAAVDGSKFGTSKIETGAAIGSQNNKLVIAAITGDGVAAATAFEKNLEVGNYTVRYKIDGYTNDAVATLSITDSQTPVTVKVKETNTEANTDLKTFLGMVDNAEFYYGDVNIKQDVTIRSVDKVINNNGKNAYVKSVTVAVKAANNDDQYYVVKVPVNRTFTTTAKYV